MKQYDWNTEKSLTLKNTRGVSFEDVIFYLEQGKMLDDIGHPNQEKYPGQRMLIIDVGGYAYLIPYVENEGVYFLKTIIPSIKATDFYLRGKG